MSIFLVVFVGGEDKKGIRKRGKIQRKWTSVNMNIKTINEHAQVHLSKNTELSKRLRLLTLPSKSSSKEHPRCDCWYFSWKSFPSNTCQGIKSSILNGKPQALLAISKVERPRTTTAPRCTPLESTCASCAHKRKQTKKGRPHKSGNISKPTTTYTHASSRAKINSPIVVTMIGLY